MKMHFALSNTVAQTAYSVKIDSTELNLFIDTDAKIYIHAWDLFNVNCKDDRAELTQKLKIRGVEISIRTLLGKFAYTNRYIPGNIPHQARRRFYCIDDLMKIDLSDITTIDIRKISLIISRGDPVIYDTDDLDQEYYDDHDVVIESKQQPRTTNVLLLEELEKNLKTHMDKLHRETMIDRGVRDPVIRGAIQEKIRAEIYPEIEKQVRLEIVGQIDKDMSLHRTLRRKAIDGDLEKYRQESMLEIEDMRKRAREQMEAELGPNALSALKKLRKFFE